ncbi:MAG: CHAT domain-containing protein [Cyanobacteria bacterium J055]|nr:MAG: CHAT domain-containing protein [Cyanobacteria bacterium J055]
MRPPRTANPHRHPTSCPHPKRHSRRIIEPISDLLPQTPEERVIFVPHSELFLVPFPALQDANGTQLIDQRTILTAPAIQVLELTENFGFQAPSF